MDENVHSVDVASALLCIVSVKKICYSTGIKADLLLPCSKMAEPQIFTKVRIYIFKYPLYFNKLMENE
jgi:hypothetical protein